MFWGVWGGFCRALEVVQCWVFKGFIGVLFFLQGLGVSFLYPFLWLCGC